MSQNKSWNKHEEAFHPTRSSTDECKPIKSWRGGNLPKLNSFVLGLEEIYRGLYIASQHDLGEMVTRIMPRIRRLCDAAISVIEMWKKEEHFLVCSKKSCALCHAMSELTSAWQALENDEVKP